MQFTNRSAPPQDVLQETFSGTDGTSGLTGPTTEIGQSFIGTGEQFVHCSFYVTPGSFPAFVSAKLYAHGGPYGSGAAVPVGTPLAVSTNHVWVSDEYAPLTWIDFYFDAYEIQTGVPYFIVLVLETASGNVLLNYASAGHAGTGAKLVSGVWEASVVDYSFRIYVAL